MSTCIERGFYLTSLQPKYTGLLRPIGIGEKFLLGHPRIEIYVDGSNVWWENKRIVHVLIKDTPQCSKADEGILPDDEMKKVYQWIILNKEVLLNHWNLKVDSIELCQRITKSHRTWHDVTYCFVVTICDRKTSHSSLVS